ncbi:MAG: ABC transporter ATP-binding protein [Anaerococcus sp.]|nr:ABC transporter ATP-binding protein [Anaerococcus sp.]
MDDIIKIKGLSKDFDGKRALDNINLNIKRGEVLGLIGPNSSGKSSLIRSIMGLISPSQGEVLIDNKKNDKAIRANISYMPDKFSFYEDLKVADLLNLYGDMYEDFNMKKCLKLIEFLSLPKDSRIKSLSKGYKKRLMGALALSRIAPIYLLDEPLEGLDPIAREAFIDLLINRLDKGASFVIASHNIGDLEYLFDRVVFLDLGKILKDSDVRELREKEKMDLADYYKEVYGLL